MGAGNILDVIGFFGMGVCQLPNIKIIVVH